MFKLNVAHKHLVQYSLILLFTSVLLVPGAQAQLAKGEIVYSANAGLCIPMGDFGDDKGDDAGGGKTNFTIGGEMDYGLSDVGWSLISSVSILRNGFDDDVLGLPNWDVDAGSYINIPIASGIKYEAKVSPTMTAYGQFQLAFNFLRPPNADLTQGQATGEIEVDTTTSFGFVFGGGVSFNDEITANLRFYSLGEPEPEATLSRTNGQSQTSESELGLSMVTLTAGYRF